MAGRLRWMVLLAVLVFGAGSALDAAGRVTVVGGDGTPSLWLPEQTPSAQQAAALDEVSRFQRRWTAFFGGAASLPDPVVVPAGGDLGEALFAALWRPASTSLAPPDRPSALGALRWAVLGDSSAVRATLAHAASAAQWGPALAEKPTLYVFLSEQMADPSFLAEALPPGPGALRLRNALARRDVPWDMFWNRYMAWLLTRAVAWGLVAPAKGSLPAVWVLDAQLKPGELTGWRFPVKDPAEGVSLELSGDVAPDVRLFHLFTDDLGRITSSGMTGLKPGPLVLPRRGSWVWVFIWNASNSEADAGAALTLWSSYQVPFVVLDSSRKGTVLDLHLRESEGIGDYRLWSLPQDEPETQSAGLAGAFPSEGEGDHYYRLQLADAPSGVHLRLTCRTVAGGSYSTDVPARESGP